MPCLGTPSASWWCDEWGMAWGCLGMAWCDEWGMGLARAARHGSRKSMQVQHGMGLARACKCSTAWVSQEQHGMVSRGGHGSRRRLFVLAPRAPCLVVPLLLHSSCPSFCTSSSPLLAKAPLPPCASRLPSVETKLYTVPSIAYCLYWVPEAILWYPSASLSSQASRRGSRVG